MSRVWKKFFVRVAKGLAISASVVVWFFAVIFFYQYIGVSKEAQEFLVPFTTVVAPALVVFLRMMFKDCKDEVERENKELLNTIKG